MFTKLIAIITLMCSFSVPVSEQGLYMRGMEVTSLNYETDVVTCVDGVGFEWQYYGCEDYCEGDIVCCLMDTMGTDKIFDDKILMVNYSGFYTH